MKKVLKFIAAVFLIGMALATFTSIIRQETYPSQMKKTVKNDVIATYYEQNGSFPAAYTHDMIDSFDYEGNIQAKYLTYLPEIGQMQISVRYGTVAFENIAKKYKLDRTPTKEDDVITFKLKALALAEGAFSNEDSNITDDEILAQSIINVSLSDDMVSGRHCYSRLVFDGIDFDTYNCLYVEMYYGDNSEPFTSIIAYHIDAAKYSQKSVKITVADCERPQQ